MPPYFLTAQLPYMLLGTDASGDPDLALDPSLTHERKVRVFCQVDSPVVAEKLLDLFRYGKPNPPADLKAPVGTIEAFKNLLEWAVQPVFGVIDIEELEFAQRVFCRDSIKVLQEIESVGDWDPGVWAAGGLPHDKGTVLLMRLRYQAQRWEPLIRDESGADDATQGQSGSTAAKAKGAYLWFTYGTIIPLDPRVDINEKFYFHKVDSEDLAARLVDMFQKSQGEKLWFGYATVDALDVGETILADASVARYQKGEVVGEDSDFSVMATRWERQLREKLSVGKTAGETAESAATVKHDGTRALPAKPPSAPTEPLAESTNGGKPSDALLEKAKTPSAPETHSKSPPAPGSVQTCNVICPNERLAGVLRQAGLNTVSVLARAVYEYDPALYVHSPDVVLGFPAAIPYPATAMHLWPEEFAHRQEAMTSALVAAGHPPLANELPEQYENLLKGLRSGALIAVAFVEPVKVDVRFRKYDSNESAAEGSAISIEDAARQFGALPPERKYAEEGLWGIAPVAVDLAEYRDEEPFVAAEGFRFEPQEPPDSRLVVPKDAPQWASELLPFLGPTIDVRLDTTWFKEKDRLVPLFQNMAGDLLGCAYRTGKGVVLLLPRCKDEAAKARLIGVLATDQWQPVQAWLLVQNECDSWGADRPCAFSVRPCNEARPELKHLLQAVKLHRLLFLWYAHARRQDFAARWETLDRREVFDPDDLKQHRGDQPLPAEVLLRHAKGVEDFANAAYEMFGAGKGVGNVFDEGVCVFWPEWQIEADGVGPLEASADEICRLAIAVLGQHTPDWACIGIVEKCRGVARSGFPRWSPHPVSWRYLEELDSAIVSLNHAIWEEETKSGIGELGAPSPKPGTGQEGGNPSDSGDGKMPTAGSTGAKSEPPPSRKKACEAYRAALSHKQELVSRTHKEVFLWLRDGGLEELKTAALIPREYTLPTNAATFDRYVREYEQHLASTRSGRSAPYGSIPRADQI